MKALNVLLMNTVSLSDRSSYGKSLLQNLHSRCWMTFTDAFALKFGLRIFWFFNRLSLIFCPFPCCGLWFIFTVEFSIEVSFIYSNNWAHTDGELLSNSTVPDGIILTPSMQVKNQWPLLNYQNIDSDGTITVQLNINDLGFIAGTDLAIDSHHAHRPVHLYSFVLTWTVIQAVPGSYSFLGRDLHWCLSLGAFPRQL